VSKPSGLKLGAAKLVDALGHLLHMLPFFLGVLGEFRLDAFAGDAVRGDGVLGVAQGADDFGGQHRLQDLDGLFDVAHIIAADGAVIEILARAIAQSGHV